MRSLLLVVALVFAVPAFAQQKTDPADSFEMDGSAALPPVTLKTLDEFPDENQGSYVLEGVEIERVARVTGQEHYFLSLYEPATRTRTSGYVTIGLQTVTQSRTLGRALIDMGVALEKTPVRLYLRMSWVNPTLRRDTSTTRVYQADVYRVEVLDKDGHVLRTLQ